MNYTFGQYEDPELALPPGDLWVFGYGSVMWQPGFSHLESHVARLHGYRRALCVWSWYHRGSPENPGLVMGLDAGGACVGRAYRVAQEDKDAVAHYLYARELVTPAYLPILHPVYLKGGSEAAVTALTFKVDRRHPQYAGKLSVEQAAHVVRHGSGASGANPDYLFSTVAHMRELGLATGPLGEIAHMVEDLL
jgi:cation transport protein ChaC